MIKNLFIFFILFISTSPHAENSLAFNQTDSITNYRDKGSGGNEKSGRYCYGVDGLPFLLVTKYHERCIMKNNGVEVVNLSFAWDWLNTLLKPYEYPCGEGRDNEVNGAYSPLNDAYYFGHVLVNMYHDWYGLNVLQHPNGQAMPLVIRVHFGENYDNAFWDGRVLSLGDGQALYPLAALDIIAHEVTHGFTEQHAGLEYHDESGALNEAMSDMAGQVALAYLSESSPALYQRLNQSNPFLLWRIGASVVREPNDALRFFDEPSRDGHSADCFDKSWARQHGEECLIDLNDVINEADRIINPDERQHFIVHTASGIFNKAFYLLAKKLSIRTSFQLMLQANSNYWTPDVNLHQAACGVIQAARDLNQDVFTLRRVFNQVGIDTQLC